MGDMVFNLLFIYFMKIFIWSGSWSEHKICMYQSTIVYEFFKQNWYELVKEPKDADYILLNGYPFEENEERIDLLTLWYYYKKYPNSKIILFWSIPGMLPYLHKYKEFILIGYKEYNKFDDIFPHKISINDIKVDNLKFFIPLNIESINLDKMWYEGLNIESKFTYTDNELNVSIDKIVNKEVEINRFWEYDGNKFSYLPDISWDYPIETCRWCGGYCTYCSIRNVYWFTKSKSIQEIIWEIKNALSKWYETIYLLDEDSASYWLDIWLDFADLLNEINKIDQKFKLKLLYFEPWRLEKLFNKIDDSVWERLDYLCIPLQTTSQRILKLMNRHYSISNVIDISQKIKKLNPNLLLVTQFIYGFPSETFEEFKDYFRMLKYFDELRFWYYSERPLTKAASIKWKLSKEEMIKRLVFLWKMKSKFLNRIFDKNETLDQWIKIFKSRKY